MDIKDAILGFLSWRAFAGYDLKRIISNAFYLDWSGNNNQVYTVLVELHRNGLVSRDVVHQESHPDRKVYSITDQGMAELKRSVLSPAELPRLRSSFLAQLAWGDILAPGELDALLAEYEHDVEMELLMCEEKERRGQPERPSRTPRETYLGRMIAENRIAFYQQELAWVRRVRSEVPLYKGKEASQ
jgi:PadR family transcriptional regulator, regulatory protein AphA